MTEEKEERENEREDARGIIPNGSTSVYAIKVNRFLRRKIMGPPGGRAGSSKREKRGGQRGG